MPLQAITLKPGIVRDGTSLSNEGGWYACDKVRFRAGLPLKIGGWVRDTGIAASSLKPPSGAYWGVARAMWNWLNLDGYNMLGIGTNLKYYIQTSGGGALHDITPIRMTTTAGAVTFTATDGSSRVVVSCTGHTTMEGDFVEFVDAVGLGGNITAGVLNAEHQVTEYISATQFAIEVPVVADASDTGNGGAATVGVFQINSGAEVYTVGLGWGAGGWGGIVQGSPAFGWGSPAVGALGIGLQLRTWSQANYGEDFIINPRGGPLYYWKNNANPTLVDRAVLLSPGSPPPFDTDSGAPVACNFMLVSDASRFVMAFGVNDYGSNVLDPLLVRWSDQENYALWNPAVTNQAGSYRLSQGSVIVCAQQTRQEVLVFTDTAVYGMQYQGPPYVWGFQILGSATSIAGPNAVATADDVTYWMGTDAFYMYNGRVQQLRCDLWRHVFNDLNPSQQYQICAGVNRAFSEVWWFYCSANSNQVDRYVVYNYREDIWYYGNMSRTAWLDSGLRNYPIATSYSGFVLYHEVGADDGDAATPAAIHAYVESSDFDIGDGEHFSFVTRIIPDVNFNGSEAPQPSVNFGIRPRQYPGAPYGTGDTKTAFSDTPYSQTLRSYSVQMFTQKLDVRVRGRQLALRVESDGAGVMWQLGTPRLDLRIDGRR